jgi:hypothetical protein
MRGLVRRDAEENLHGDVFVQLRRPALRRRHGEEAPVLVLSQGEGLVGWVLREDGGVDGEIYIFAIIRSSPIRL